MISLFYKNYLKKKIAIFLPMNSNLLIARLTVKAITKMFFINQKQYQLTNSINKYIKKN